MTQGQGILMVAGVIAKWVPRTLPPEHRIAATRGLPGTDMVEWLIEGPLLPETAPGAEPVPVRIVVAAIQDEGADGVRMTGEFQVVSRTSILYPGAKWEIGVWPNIEAWRREFLGLFAG